MARLATHVHLNDSQGRPHVFGPEDEVPAWAQEIITNPGAWAEPPSVSRLTEPAPQPVKRAAAKRAAPRRKAAADGPVQPD